jgi:sugar lactone lactonase YvrE
MQPKLLLDARAYLGEGPSWDASRSCLYWVNIPAGEVHIFSPHNQRDEIIHLGEPVGCIAPSRNGEELVVALRSGFATLNLSTQTLTRLLGPEKHLPGNRFNDGKCDPAGRFLAGTMDDSEKAATGSLYSFSADGTLKTLLSGLHISNGLTWSPDQRVFYFIDTPTRQVTAYDYDLAIGALANPRPVINVPPALGWPDGMTSDSEGMLWVAMWGGAKLTRWNPASGQLMEVIPIPALNVTSCTFGGADLSDLYITSARKGLDEAQLAEYPLSGGLFCVRMKYCGLPSFIFGGYPAVIS